MGRQTGSEMPTPPPTSKPIGCVFAGFGPQPHTFNPQISPEAESLVACPFRSSTIKRPSDNPPEYAEIILPSEDEIVGIALGAPARRVLQRAEALGPKTGWRDGHLTSDYGFCPPDPSSSPTALSLSPGHVWSDLCDRLPSIVRQGKARQAIEHLPYVDPATIPDTALWAAVVCLGILAHTYRYEDRYDGYDGITRQVAQCNLEDLAHVISGNETQQPETQGLPDNLALPYKNVSARLGRPLPHLTPFDLSLNNYRIIDPTSVFPYLERNENMALRWSAFRSQAESVFLLCWAEFHGCFKPGVEIMVRCQEAVLAKDNDNLLKELVKLKALVDQLVVVFHKIDLNPRAEGYTDPIEWGQQYAKFSFPLSERVPTHSGMHLPIFHVLDAFLGRTEYSSYLGRDALNLRKWLPFNIRAFIVSIERYYNIPEYIRKSGERRLIGVLEGIVESYTGERGFMGVHRYKVYGFLELSGKTGRAETNSGAMKKDAEGRPWEKIHDSLADSMMERLSQYGAIAREPHQIRGSFQECRIKARILSRQVIDQDRGRRTAKVKIDLIDTGVTFNPGDRVLIMPLNRHEDIEKVVDVLDLGDLLELDVPASGLWALYKQHMVEIYPEFRNLSVRKVLRSGKLAPVTKELALKIDTRIQSSSVTLSKLLLSETAWPLWCSIGDLMKIARSEVTAEIWQCAFDLCDLSWLPDLIPTEVPRTYNISNFSPEPLPSFLELTVTRTEYRTFNLISPNKGQAAIRPGISSGFLNPLPLTEPSHSNGLEQVLIGISRPFKFHLPPSPNVPILMFAGGSGIAPFRAFWQARLHSGSSGRNILFFGAKYRKMFLYEDEIRDLVAQEKLEVHLAFSRDRNGVIHDRKRRRLVEREMNPRYVDSAILEAGAEIAEAIAPAENGGLGGYIYICGSTSFYETISRALLNLPRYHTGGEKQLETAFAQGRVMLDIFSFPKPISSFLPIISTTDLARNTGHRNGSVWIAVHGNVYDVTGFLPIHPGGPLIISTNAGRDCSTIFGRVGHTSNGEVMGLLSNYLVGTLAQFPSFPLPGITALFEMWRNYLDSCVEAMTSISLELAALQDHHSWFKHGMFDMCIVRRLYQFQSRFLDDVIDKLFGTTLREMHLKASTMLLASRPSLCPDTIGIVTLAQTSRAAIESRNTVAQLGEFLSSGINAEDMRENSILIYAQTVTDLEIKFLEQVREELCLGLDAFSALELQDLIRGSEKQAMFCISALLLSCLHRIAYRLQAFYTDCSLYSLQSPSRAMSAAKRLWNLLSRRIKDGSFFVLSEDLSGQIWTQAIPRSVRSRQSNMTRVGAV